MRIGATIFNQNYTDWDRYEAEERGEQVAAHPPRPDRDVFREEIDIARIAGITQRVDLGTMVTVLPWHHPVRVAEDVNMLDTLLGPNREIICGVGRGLGRREYAGLGIDQAEARERFDESLQVLRMLLETGKCDFEGKHYQIKGLKLRPQPDRDLSPNLWCAGGTNDTVDLIARHNVRPLVIPTTTIEFGLETARRYAQMHQAAGYAPSKTKLALWTYVAETEEAARRGAEQYMVEYADSALRHYELRGSHLGAIKGYESYGLMQKALSADPTPFLRGFFNSHPWGTPDQVIRRASELAETFGTDEIMFIFKYGSMPMAAAEKSMTLFAQEVMPALQALNPRPIEVRAAA